MPGILYEFKCQKGHKFEARKPFKESSYAQCPFCGLMGAKIFSVVHNTFGWDWDWQNGKYKGEKNIVRNV